MKLKIAGIVLLIAAVIIATVYGIVAAVTFGREDYGLYSGNSAPEARPVEIAYNAIRYTSGAYKYGVQVYADIERLTEGLSPEERSEVEIKVKDAVSTAEKVMKDLGAHIEQDSDPYYFSATTMSFSSATEMDIALGNDGYEVYGFSGKIYNGFWYSDYVSETTDPFATSDGYLTDVKEAMLTAVDASELDLIYNYGSPYGLRTIESNAGYVYKYTEKNSGPETYIHEFRRGAKEDAIEIILVQHSPNTVSWYLVIIDAVLLITGAVMLITGVRRGTSRSYYER